MAQLQKDVVWLVLSRSVAVLVVVTWPVLFALALGSSFRFAPSIAVRLVSKRSQLWNPRHSRSNKLRLFMVSEPTQAKPTTQTISSRSVQLAGLDRPDALSPRVRWTLDSRHLYSQAGAVGQIQPESLLHPHEVFEEPRVVSDVIFRRVRQRNHVGHESDQARAEGCAAKRVAR